MSFKPTFSLSSFTFIKRLFSSSSLSALRMVSSAYLRLFLLLPAILIPAYASSNLAFHMMYSAYKLNKWGDNTQPWHTPFPIWNQSVVPRPALTVAPWPAYRFEWRRTKEPLDESERGEWKSLKLNIQKTKIMASGPITSWEIDGETVTDFIFLGSKITADGDCSHEIKRRLLLGRKAMTNLDSILKSRDITLLTGLSSQSYGFFQ